MPRSARATADIDEGLDQIPDIRGHESIIGQKTPAEKIIAYHGASIFQPAPPGSQPTVMAIIGKVLETDQAAEKGTLQRLPAILFGAAGFRALAADRQAVFPDPRQEFLFHRDIIRDYGGKRINAHRRQRLIRRRGPAGGRPCRKKSTAPGPGRPGRRTGRSLSWLGISIIGMVFIPACL